MKNRITSLAARLHVSGMDFARRLRDEDRGSLTSEEIIYAAAKIGIAVIVAGTIVALIKHKMLGLNF